MITLEQATLIVKSERDYFDTWEEYEHYYLFTWSNAPESEGGWDSPIVVIKESGEIKNYLYVVTKTNWGDDCLLAKGNC